jgi:hypothetical protein
MSTGLYTHISKAAGTIVDAPLYNNAHQNHLTNDIPTSAGANSDTVTDYQTTLDPAPANVPAIVASIALELEQLRFVLADIDTGINLGVPPAFWYTPVNTPTSGSVETYGAAVSKTSTSVPRNTIVLVSFNTTTYDTNGPDGSPFFSLGAPTVFTAPVRGIYLIHGTGQWSTPTLLAGLTEAVSIVRNGSQILAQTIIDSTSVDPGNMEVSTEYLLEAGDTVSLALFQLADINPMGFGFAQFRIQWLGGASS